MNVETLSMLKRHLRTAISVAAATLLVSCGGYVPHQYPPVMVPDLMKIAIRKNFKAVDNLSFANAVMLYPTRTGDSFHKVPVGDYLLSRVVLALPEDVEIARIRLDNYDSKCESRGLIAPHLWCVTDAQVAITVRGKDRILRVADEVDVGPVLIPGDVSLPFTTGDTFDGVIHDQARKTVDRISIKAADAFKQSAHP